MTEAPASRVGLTITVFDCANFHTGNIPWHSMSDNIVNFPKQDVNRWVCADCGCVTFFLYSDNTTECAHCGVIDPDGMWQPDADRVKEWDVEANDGCTKRVIEGDDHEFARLSMVRAIENPEGLFGVFLIFDDGRTRVWHSNEIDTDERVEWFNRKLDEITDVVKRTKFKTKGGTDE